MKRESTANAKLLKLHVGRNVGCQKEKAPIKGAFRLFWRREEDSIPFPNFKEYPPMIQYSCGFQLFKGCGFGVW